MVSADAVQAHPAMLAAATIGQTDGRGARIIARAPAMLTLLAVLIYAPQRRPALSSAGARITVPRRSISPSRAHLSSAR